MSTKLKKNELLKKLTGSCDNNQMKLLFFLVNKLPYELHNGCIIDINALSFSEIKCILTIISKMEPISRIEK